MDFIHHKNKKTLSKLDNRVDLYINNAQEFAKPILEHLRYLVHQSNPDIQETIKWGMPWFEYKGALCHMGAFKKHVVFSFWKSALINDSGTYLKARANQGGEAMGHLGKIMSSDDLPPNEVLIDFLRQAIKLNEKGVKLPVKAKTTVTQLIIPDYFNDALQNNIMALETFNNFSDSCKKEYINWITEAKTEKTRNKRMLTALEWISEGKTRNWKY